MDFLRRLFGQKERTHHPLLDRALPSQPVETQLKLRRAFDPLSRANIEFFTWISPDPAACKRISDEASSKNIAVWCNNDQRTAFFYGLGEVDRDSFVDVMNWIRDITVNGKKAMVRTVKQDSSDMYVEISKCQS
jgi:hypothetical protein